MTTRWNVVAPISQTAEDDLFAFVTLALVELTGARAVVLVMASGDEGQVLASYPEVPKARFSLKESAFDGLPDAPGTFRAAVPADLCGVPLYAGSGVLLGASADAGPERRILVGVVSDGDALARVSPLAMMSSTVRAVACVVDAAEREAHVRDRGFIRPAANGHPAQRLGPLHDISELRELEQRIALADRMASIGTLTAGIAHEINNPLTYVLGNIDMVLSGLDSHARDRAPDVVEMLREAHHGAVRVSEIVRGMRTFARSEPGASKMADVDRVVESALAMAKNELRHRARLVTRLDAAPAAVDEPTLVLVVLNLLMNAAHALPEGRRDEHEVAVTTGVAPDGRIFIEVRDTGEGMTAETMRRIFEPFFTTKDVGQGRGLGLSLVHSAVTSSGGEVTVTSARGAGSTFRVLLAPAVESDPSTSMSLAPSRSRGRVLIVDDEAPVVRVLRRMLAKDHDVIVAASGADGLQILRADPEVDVVLCDVMMPDLTGAELHRQIASEAPSVAERFVFVTGGAFGEQARAYVQSTMQPTITKPFRAAEVTQAIDLVRQRNSAAPPSTAVGR